MRDPAVAFAPARSGPLLLPPWDGLDDAGLLAHLRSRRDVDIDLVVDADECSPERLAGVMRGEFELAGERHALGARPDWLRNPSADIEWHILLHKFYYAAGLARDFAASGDPRLAQRWVELLGSWMDQVAPGFIAADVTGRRVQNWIYSLQGFVGPGRAACDAITPAFVRRLLASLHEQVEYLCINLTPKRNHRTLELYAIFLAGVAFPEMRRAAFWRAFALEQTVRNMQLDLLADGVHCELSTDYHHLALRNWLHVRQLAARNGIAVPPELDRQLERGLEFSLHVHKPDGAVPSLSDGDARSFLPLLAAGAELFGREDMRHVATRGAAGRVPDATLAHFPASGYTVVRSGWDPDAHYLVLDTGPLGEGNHGHFDCLNFELAAFGRSLVVDPGRYTYSEAGDTNWRVHFRSTAAHNTVCVDGLNQTRYEPRPVKGASRHAAGSVRHKIAGAAPDGALLDLAQGGGLTLLHGRTVSHVYDAVHERCVAFIDAGLWLLGDWLRASCEHEYALHLQLSPAAQGRTELDRGASTRWRSPGLTVVQVRSQGIEPAIVEGWVSERYGHKQPAPRLRATVTARDADFSTVLVPWREREPAVAVDVVRVEGAGILADALRIQHDIGGTPRVDFWLHTRDAAAPLWRWADFEFHGRWLHLVLAPGGEPVRATSHAGARLWHRGREHELQGITAASS